MKMKRRIYAFIKLLLIMPSFVALILALVGIFVLSPFMVLIEPRVLDKLVRSLKGY